MYHLSSGGEKKKKEAGTISFQNKNIYPRGSGSRGGFNQTVWGLKVIKINTHHRGKKTGLKIIPKKKPVRSM